MDNSEHLVHSVADLTETLLRDCPELRVLAASREALGFQGEAVMQVPPLTVPNSDEPLSDRNLLDYGAVALFAERASAVPPRFALSEQNHAMVSEICRRLDGLPLAIELAASRLAALSERDILARLSDTRTC